MFLDDRVLVELGTVQGSARIPHIGTEIMMGDG